MIDWKSEAHIVLIYKPVSSLCAQGACAYQLNNTENAGCLLKLSAIFN